MTVQLDWPPDVVDRLSEAARQKGQTLDKSVLEAELQHESSGGKPTAEEEGRRF